MVSRGLKCRDFSFPDKRWGKLKQKRWARRGLMHQKKRLKRPAYWTRRAGGWSGGVDEGHLGEQPKKKPRK